MKKIDIHLHVRQKPYLENGIVQVSSAEDMLRHMNELGIEKGIVLSSGEHPTDARMCGNAEAAAIHAADPKHFAFMCNVDDTMKPDEVFACLSAWKDKGAVGVGELTVNRRIDDPLLEAVFDACGKLDLPVTFHMSPEVGYSYGIVDDLGLPLLERALKKFPNTKFLGHSPTFWIEISADVPTGRARNQWGKGPVKPGGKVPELFHNYQNLYGDLSANSAGEAIMRDPEFGLDFLTSYSDRLLFATDMVHTEMVFPLGAWLDEMCSQGKLSEADYSAIIRGNAQRLYHL